MSLLDKIFLSINQRIGKASSGDLAKVEDFLRNLMGMVEFAKKTKLDIENGAELVDNHVNIEQVHICLEEHKEEKIELDPDEEIDDKKSIQRKEKKQIEQIELEKQEKISNKEKPKPKQPEKIIEIKEIPLKLNIIEDPLKLLTKFKNPIDPRPYITADVAPRKNFFFVANLDDVNFFRYGKCKKCNELIECSKCKIHPLNDGVRIIFSMFFLDENPLKVVAFNETITKYFKINRKTLIEITKNQKDALRMKFLDLYRNRLLVFHAKFKDLKKTQETTTNHIFCWKEKNIARYFQKLEVQ